MVYGKKFTDWLGDTWESIKDGASSVWDGVKETWSGFVDCLRYLARSLIGLRAMERIS